MWTLFIQTTAKGLTIIFASGDSGSGYTSRGASSNPVLWPSWPASSPYVTAVGATRFAKNKAGAAYTQEMASVAFGSGGGFSKQFSQTPNATWQSAAVAKYLTSAVTKSLPFPPRTAFPASGRATPDVSSLGEGFQTYISGRVEAVGGTSASAPLFAGLVSLLNEARLSAGKPSMGLLNPFLCKLIKKYEPCKISLSPPISRLHHSQISLQTRTRMPSATLSLAQMPSDAEQARSTVSAHFPGSTTAPNSGM